VLHEGGGGVRGGFTGFVLLGEGEGEVMVGDPVGGVFGEGVAPGFFGGREFAGGVVGGRRGDLRVGSGERSGGVGGG
jgi:hypothetical protein